MYSIYACGAFVFSYLHVIYHTPPKVLENVDFNDYTYVSGESVVLPIVST